jgi:TolB-like protein
MSSPPPIPAGEIRRHLDALVASPVLMSSAQLCRFLRYIVERTLAGDTGSLKENLLGTEVFDRGVRFDPRTDPVVRVEARRLRAKLDEYYSKHGAHAPLMIRLPKGSYVPQFEHAGVAASRIVASGGSRAAMAAEAETQFSVAVLPFASVGADSETEYFADGLTDEVINLLGNIRGMRVVARSSVYQFKGRTGDAREFGRHLNATHLLEGSVRRDDCRLRIAAQFVESRNGYQIWGQTFERDWKEIFAIQEEIASSIARKLKLRADGERNPLFTENLEAYNAYLKGRYYWNKRNVPSFQLAIEAFRQAIDLEPDYAPAWAGLADCYTMLGFSHATSPLDLREKARSAAERALALDANLAAAHIALAQVFAVYDWDWDRAILSLRRALELDANCPDAHYGLSKILGSLGRMDEAIAEMQQAQQLDPLSLMYSVSLAWELAAAERYHESDQQFQATRELDRTFVWSYFLQSWSFQARGMFEEAVAHLRIATGLASDSSLILGELAHALGKANRREEAAGILAKLEMMGKERYVSAFEVARAYEGLGRRAEALEAMHRACDERAPMLLFAKADPVFDPFRGEARFEELLKRLNLA